MIYQIFSIGSSGFAASLFLTPSDLTLILLPLHTSSSPPLLPSSCHYRYVPDSRGQGLRRRPRRRHGHHQRRGRSLRSRGQEGVLHLDQGPWRMWSRGTGGVGGGGGGVGVEVVGSRPHGEAPFVFLSALVLWAVDREMEGGRGRTVGGASSGNCPLSCHDKGTWDVFFSFFFLICTDARTNRSHTHTHTHTYIHTYMHTHKKSIGNSVT